MKVVFATPSLCGPTKPYISSLEASVKLITAAGYKEGYVQELGCPYISAARATMTTKALAAEADVIIYLDYDLSWNPWDLLTLLQTPGDVVAGTYRFKKPEEEYMGVLFANDDGTPIVRADGCLKAQSAPAGFLKVTRAAIEQFKAGYPNLCYGEAGSVDLFNHGAHQGQWWGEDYAFCRNWRDIGGDVWIIPYLNITHWDAAGNAFSGNFHKYLLRQPGGSECPETQKGGIDHA